MPARPPPVAYAAVFLVVAPLMAVLAGELASHMTNERRIFGMLEFCVIPIAWLVSWLAIDAVRWGLSKVVSRLER